MKIKNVWICAGVLLACLLSGRSLHAQSSAGPSVTGDDDKPWNKGIAVKVREEARDLFLEGNRLFRIPLFAQAAEKYAAALTRWKHPAFYFNLAIAQLNLGQDVEAHENLERALAHGEEPLGAAEFQEAQKQLREVERQLGRISVTCQTKGAEVTLNGVPLFTGPGSHQGWVKARTHEIAAKRAGYLAVSRRVTVASGTLQTVELKLFTLDEAANSGRRWAVWQPWTVLAAGIAIAGAGGGLHALASRNFNSFDEQFLQLPCVTSPTSGPPGCSDEEVGPVLNDQLKRARQQQQLAVGGYIAGGTLIAAGVVMLYMNRPRPVEGAGISSPAGRVAIVPAVSPDMLGVVMSVSR